MGEDNMDEKTGVILKDLFLDALETYREDNADYENEFYDLLGKLMKKAKEGFLDLKSTGLVDDNYYNDSDPGTYEHFMALSYAIELCSLIPDATERATKLLTKVTYKDLDTVTEKYMEEASRCYIYGFYLAAAIMCRGSIEYSLKKYLGITESKENNKIYFITNLLDKAINRGGSFSIIDKRIVQSIYNGASACVHGRRQINSAKCLEYINNTKMIIEKLLH
jgi:HEPN domain-containing protein